MYHTSQISWNSSYFEHLCQCPCQFVIQSWERERILEILTLTKDHKSWKKFLTEGVSFLKYFRTKCVYSLVQLIILFIYLNSSSQCSLERLSGRVVVSPAARSVCVWEGSTTTWQMWAPTPTTTPSLKWWAAGPLVIISRLVLKKSKDKFFFLSFLQVSVLQ